MRAEKQQLKLKLKALPFPQSVVEEFRKSDEFVDCALEVKKGEVAAYLQVLIDEIREMDPKFLIWEVKSFHDFIENDYAKDALLMLKV